MRRIINLDVFNSRELQFVKPKGFVALFDGNVELEQSCFVIENETLRLLRTPAFEVRGLVETAVI